MLPRARRSDGTGARASAIPNRRWYGDGLDPSANGPFRLLRSRAKTRDATRGTIGAWRRKCVTIRGFQESNVGSRDPPLAVVGPHGGMVGCTDRAAIPTASSRTGVAVWPRSRPWRLAVRSGLVRSRCLKCNRIREILRGTVWGTLAVYPRKSLSYRQLHECRGGPSKIAHVMPGDVRCRPKTDEEMDGRRSEHNELWLMTR